MWNEVNSILNKKSKQLTIPSIINPLTQETYTAPAKIIDTLNQHFETVGTQLNNAFVNTQHNAEKYMKKTTDNSINLCKTTEKEVLDIIDKLPNKSSSGPDGISQLLLKKVAPEITPIITKLINLAIKNKVYPNCLKISKIIPIFKMVTKKIVIITDQFPYYHALTKFSKKF
jgi:hypothetical protein